MRAPREARDCQLQSDWDWHRLVKALKTGSPMERQLRRLLVREGFRLFAGAWSEDSEEFSKTNFPEMRRLRRGLETAPANTWAGFQLYYPMREDEVRRTTGVDLIESMLAVFEEVTPVMNECMEISI